MEHYVLNGKKYPRTTTILKSTLDNIKLIKKIGKKIANRININLKEREVKDYENIYSGILD